MGTVTNDLGSCRGELVGGGLGGEDIVLVGHDHAGLQVGLKQGWKGLRRRVVVDFARLDWVELAEWHNDPEPEMTTLGGFDSFSCQNTLGGHLGPLHPLSCLSYRLFGRRIKGPHPW